MHQALRFKADYGGICILVIQWKWKFVTLSFLAIDRHLNSWFLYWELEQIACTQGGDNEYFYSKKGLTREFILGIIMK